MGQERLPVNIFPGVLPGAYVLLDNGEDNTKWNSACPLMWQPLNNMASINTGDAFGYYGRGLNFLYTVGAGLQKSGNAYRTFVSMPTDVYYFGFTFRISAPNLLNVGPAPLIGDPARSGNITLSVNNAGNRFGFVSVTFYLCQATATRIDFGVNVLGAAGNSTRVHQKFLDYANLGEEVFAYTQWHRFACVCNFSDNLIQAIRVDSQLYGNNLPLALSPGSNEPNYLHANAVATDLAAGNIFFDLDQIWISDTENRV